MNNGFWLLNPVALAAISVVILLIAWPLEYVPALVAAAVIMVAAAGIGIRGYFLAPAR